MSVIPILGAGLNDKIANNRYLEPKQAYESFYSLTSAYTCWQTEDYTLGAFLPVWSF